MSDYQAEFIKDVSEDFRGIAKLWRITPPVIYTEWNEDDGEIDLEAEYVITSATVALFSGPETYIFPADSEGNVLNWMELPGSYRGAMDHEFAISQIGSRI